MMPLILTKPLKVLVIGGGNAGLIKARSALRYQMDVTLISTDFSVDANEVPCRRVRADFYRMSVGELSDWDLIYLAIPWPESREKQAYIERWAETIKESNKLLCVSCRPSLGNVVNPCSRRVADYTLTLSGGDMRPKNTKTLTEQLSQRFALMLKDKVINEKIETL
ncbi:NAD(P)-dependent oxidoreductase [uncultured Shewanella sp.]|uniref:NAD(P)-dependent oxidoreductase n=1 Tax=Shewanella atlantica TaxID=271099 RepID=UPI002605B627|nr:NAD(P)-dependent oxidoreductase [uncultured Shewanella sp.]